MITDRRRFRSEKKGSDYCCKKFMTKSLSLSPSSSESQIVGVGTVPAMDGYYRPALLCGHMDLPNFVLQ